MKSLVYLLLAGICLASCKGKEVQCTAKTTPAPLPIAFTGYTRAQLSRIWVSSYRPDGSFRYFIATDTLVTPDGYQAGDTVFASSILQPFAQLTSLSDYEVTIPATNDHYRITDIRYGTDTVRVWTANGECNTNYGSLLQFVASARVNGELVYPAYGNWPVPFVFLHLK